MASAGSLNQNKIPPTCEAYQKAVKEARHEDVGECEHCGKAFSNDNPGMWVDGKAVFCERDCWVKWKAVEEYAGAGGLRFADGLSINSGNPAFDALLMRMADIHRAKNHDYAKPEKQDYYSNFRECEDMGITASQGISVRMSDKWSRIKRLEAREAKVPDESIEDTLLDLANYALLKILVRREDRGE